jgi:hypothetical protein
VQLTPEQTKRITDKLDGFWRTVQMCPICSSNEWAIHDRIHQMTEFSGGSLVVGGPVVPFVLVNCQVCGYTISFNAIALGVVDAATGKVVDG